MGIGELSYSATLVAGDYVTQILPARKVHSAIFGSTVFGRNFDMFDVYLLLYMYFPMVVGIIRPARPTSCPHVFFMFNLRGTIF